MSSTILIVDDEPAIGKALRPVLTSMGWEVATAETGAKGLQAASQQAADIVLLDLGLPDCDGKELIPTFRERFPVAIIIISARHQEEEKVAALDAGADDYVDKPFRMNELMARIRAAQRRLEEKTTPKLVFDVGDLHLDAAQRRARLSGVELKFSPKEFSLLRLLMEHAGQVVTHRRLLIAGWGDPLTDPQYLRTYIALLRQKLEEDPSEPQIVITEPGIGYRLNA